MRAVKRSSIGGSGPPWPGRRLLAAIAVAIVVAGAVWGFLAGQAERAKDVDDEAVAEPQRVSIVDGAPVVTLDAATQAASGL